MTEEKKTPKKTDETVDDLTPRRDPKGGQTATESDVKTTVRSGAARGGWDGNHNQVPTKKPQHGVEDLTPQQDPKGGQTAAESESLKTKVRSGTATGGWDANHNRVPASAGARRSPRR